MIVFEIFCAILLLFNKIFLFSRKAKKKTIGWIFGIVGVFFTAIYFYRRIQIEHEPKFWVSVIYNIAAFFIMGYGYLVSTSLNKKKLHDFLERYDIFFKVTIVLIALGISVYLVYEAIQANLVILQFCSSIGGFAGTLLLALHRKKTNKIGWVCYFFTHLNSMYLMYIVHSRYYAIGQVISAVISVFAFLREFEPGKEISPLNAAM